MLVASFRLYIIFLGTPFVVIVAQNIEDARASGNTALSSPCWDLLALMRRVVNYHNSCVGQCLRLLSRSSCIASAFYLCWFPGYSAGRGVGPAGGTPGGG
ncbi:hypothetical protein F511_38040 [Dorcoceras hygrometricum]|uniref:Secreted protein n=1 Tax=Dorcoceras hygrometricum TaxID=472368 RepID=A0A2Z7CQN8_9LAMI|nr:hypothetical protein F511_38040 [Dorcoceras hygrometricum]